MQESKSSLHLNIYFHGTHTHTHIDYSLDYLETQEKKRREKIEKKMPMSKKKTNFVHRDKTSWLLDRCARTRLTHKLSDNGVKCEGDKTKKTLLARLRFVRCVLIKNIKRKAKEKHHRKC